MHCRSCVVPPWKLAERLETQAFLADRLGIGDVDIPIRIVPDHEARFADELIAVPHRGAQVLAATAGRAIIHAVLLWPARASLDLWRLRHLVDLFDPQRLAPVHCDDWPVGRRLRVLLDQWFVGADLAKDQVAGMLDLASGVWAPTEHRDWHAVRPDERDAQLPERTTASVNASLHADVDGQPVAELAVAPEVATHDLRQRIVDGVGEGELRVN